MSERRGWLAWLGRTIAAPFVAAGRFGQRAITSLPWSHGGPRANVVNAESALSLIPLFACVRILSDQLASLPVQTYRRLGGERMPMSNLPQLLREPAARDNRFQWVHKAVVSLALRGNAYGLVTARDGHDFPTQVEWLHPDDVFVDEQRPTLPVYYWMGVEVPREDVVHIPWLVQPGRVLGLSPVAAFASTIGVGLSTTQYGRSWFESGGTPPATMKNTAKTVTPDEAEEISQRLSSSMRQRRPLVYGMDWDFTAIAVNPEESQFIETMRLNATQIAAIFGIPAEMVGGDTGGSLTYSSPEQSMIYLAHVSLRPWVVRLEEAFSDLLPDLQFLKFNTDAMIRTDLLSRYRAHHLALLAGWRNRNEIRALEDLPPMPDGELFSQQLFRQDGGDAGQEQPGAAAEGGANRALAGFAEFELPEVETVGGHQNGHGRDRGLPRNTGVSE